MFNSSSFLSIFFFILYLLIIVFFPFSLNPSFPSYLSFTFFSISSIHFPVFISPLIWIIFSDHLYQSWLTSDLENTIMLVKNRDKYHINVIFIFILVNHTWCLSPFVVIWSVLKVALSSLSCRATNRDPAITSLLIQVMENKMHKTNIGGNGNIDMIYKMKMWCRKENMTNPVSIKGTSFSLGQASETLVDSCIHCTYSCYVRRRRPRVSSWEQPWRWRWSHVGEKTTTRRKSDSHFLQLTFLDHTWLVLRLPRTFRKDFVSAAFVRKRVTHYSLLLLCLEIAWDAVSLEEMLACSLR